MLGQSGAAHAANGTDAPRRINARYIITATSEYAMMSVEYAARVSIYADTASASAASAASRSRRRFVRATAAALDAMVADSRRASGVMRIMRRAESARPA